MTESSFSQNYAKQSSFSQSYTESSFSQIQSLVPPIPCNLLLDQIIQISHRLYLSTTKLVNRAKSSFDEMAHNTNLPQKNKSQYFYMKVTGTTKSKVPVDRWIS